MATIVATAVLVVLLVALRFFFWFVPRGPTFTRPSAWDTLIDTRFLIGIIRLVGLLVGLTAATYIIASVIGLLKAGRWLLTFGPARAQAETTDAVAGQSANLFRRGHVVQPLDAGTVEEQRPVVLDPMYASSRLGTHSVVAGEAVAPLDGVGGVLRSGCGRSQVVAAVDWVRRVVPRVDPVAVERLEGVGI